MTRRYRRVTSGHSAQRLKRARRMRTVPGGAQAYPPRVRWHVVPYGTGSVSRRVSFTECGLTECAVNVSCGRNGCRRATGALNSRCDDSCDASGRLRQATDLRRQRAKVNATPLSGRPRLRRRPRDPGVESAGSTMAARALDGVAYLLHLYARRLVQPLKAVPIICRFPQCAKKLPPLQAPAVRMVEVDAEHAGQRLDNYLLRLCKGVPKTHIYKAIRGGEVRVNKGRIQADYCGRGRHRPHSAPEAARSWRACPCRPPSSRWSTRMTPCWWSTSPPAWRCTAAAACLSA